MPDVTPTPNATVAVVYRDAEAHGAEPGEARELPWFDDPDDCPGGDAVCRACFWAWAEQHGVTLPDGWELDAVGEPRRTLTATG